MDKEGKREVPEFDAMIADRGQEDLPDFESEVVRRHQIEQVARYDSLAWYVAYSRRPESLVELFQLSEDEQAVFMRGCGLEPGDYEEVIRFADEVIEASGMIHHG